MANAIHELLDEVLAAHLISSELEPYLMAPVERTQLDVFWGSRNAHRFLYDVYTWRGGMDVVRQHKDDIWTCLLIEFDFVPPDYLLYVWDVHRTVASPFTPHERVNIWRDDWTPVFVLAGAEDTLAVDPDGAIWWVTSDGVDLVSPSPEELLRHAARRLLAGERERLF